MSIPVVDLFAGPGGLGEEFSSLRDEHGRHCFDIRLSIEKDPAAHNTLLLRRLLLSFGGSPPAEHYEYIRGGITGTGVFEIKSVNA